MAINELDRIREEYARRDQDNLELQRYSIFNPANLYTLQNRDREILKLLLRTGYTDLSCLRILDLGCGSGGELLRWIGYGASPALCTGIDLLHNRLLQARAQLPTSTQLQQGDASSLPYPDSSIDIVLTFTVYSSIMNKQMRQQIANETLRILAPDGMILWYDFWLNPTNPQTRGVRASEIRDLFPHCRFEFHKITLAPPLARRLVPISWGFAYLLENFRVFNTHFLAAIRPESITS